ncbi:Fic family protein [Ruminococcaceae bacterium OttesenSCG-928-A11]|nr:Fic family protein [Ruminococcaceae bacterium OttesenSCG-928-A11]
MFPYTGEFREKIIQDGRKHYRSTSFTPRPLMEGGFFEMDDELALLLISAHCSLGILDGMVKYMPNREVIRDLMILKECYYSRLIDYNEPGLFEVMASINTGKPDYSHIGHIATAYKRAIGRQIGGRTLPETCTMALYGEEPEEKVYLRKTSIQISRRYDPAPATEVLPAINDMSRFIADCKDIDILAKAALAHYQFEAIHPFEYYNGIVGRIMTPMILHNAGYESASYFNLSQYMYFHANDYFDLLQRTQFSGGYLIWVKFFVKGIGAATKHAIDQIDEMQRVIAADEDKIKTSKSSTKSTWMVYNYYKKNLVSTLRPAADKLGIAYNSVLKAVSILVDLGVLTSMDKKVRYRSYRHRELVEIINKTAKGKG